MDLEWDFVMANSSEQRNSISIQSSCDYLSCDSSSLSASDLSLSVKDLLCDIREESSWKVVEESNSNEDCDSWALHLTPSDGEELVLCGPPSPSTTSVLSLSSLCCSDQTVSMVSLNDTEDTAQSHPTDTGVNEVGQVSVTSTVSGIGGANTFSLDSSRNNSPLTTLSTNSPNRVSIVQMRRSRMGGANGLEMRPNIKTEKSMKCLDTRIRHTLKESDASNNEMSSSSYPKTIHLPDGEEKYWGKYKNFRLRTPDYDFAMTDNCIHAPPNVTVDHSVCENMYWNEGHRCQGDNSLQCGPPSYGSQMIPWEPVSGDSYKFHSSSSCSSSSHDQHQSSTKTAKLKEVFSSFVRSVLPGSSSTSRASCRNNKDDVASHKEAISSSRVTKNWSPINGISGNTSPIMTTGSCAVTRHTGGDNGGIIRSSPTSYSTVSPASLSNFRPGELPPSYERAMRDKKKEQKPKK